MLLLITRLFLKLAGGLIMNMINKKKSTDRRPLITMLAAVMVLTSVIIFMPTSCADTQVKLNIDGRSIDASAAPMIKNSRTLVPVRIISEELGAEVTWNDTDRSVYIAKGDRSVLLRIDRNFVEYTAGGVKSYDLTDAAPQIVNDTTYVPIRLIGNALGVGIQWNKDSQTIAVNSKETSSITPFFDMSIVSVQSGETISGTSSLQAALPSPVPTGAVQIKYLLLDPDTGSGFIIARGSDLTAAYQWLPKTSDNGEKLLAAVLYDSSGKFLAGTVKPVQVELTPTVVLSGLTQNQTVSGAVDLRANLNFSAAYVTYKITNTDNGKTTVTSEQDPAGVYSWAPSIEYNGNVAVSATAYDQKKQAYEGQPVSVAAAVPRNFSLTGIASGKTVNGPVTLTAIRNFDVLNTEYFSRDQATGAEQSLAKFEYGSYTWFPGPESSGNKELFVRVTDTNGIVYTSNIIPVYVQGTAKLLLQGAGPDQVITSASPAKLKVAGNITLSNVKYVMTNTATGTQKVIAALQDSSQEFSYIPALEDGGSWELKAVGTYGNGQTISTEVVKVKIYTGTVYPPQAIVAKADFQSMASNLAVADSRISGMSAALQTAQAMLESGWGQSIPVDKYSGKLSYNLFGIKGTGTAGTVISNTWEEYNGVRYRIDDGFRAYNNVSESWADHNKLLMNVSRYAPYRAVMYDSSLGAWALKRCGYATDSKYPVKLINLIEQYGLQELDRVRL